MWFKAFVRLNRWIRVRIFVIRHSYMISIFYNNVIYDR